MKTRNLAAAAVGLCLAVSAARARSALAETAAVPAPPQTEKIPVTDSYHGVSVVDEYRWLEDGNDPKVKAWVAARWRRSSKPAWCRLPPAHPWRLASVHS